MCYYVQVGLRPTRIELTAEEYRTLTSFERGASSPQALAQRARIVLLANDGLCNAEIARRLGVSRPTVGHWRMAFAKQRLDGLRDAPRGGRPLSHDHELVDQVIFDISGTSKEITKLSSRDIANATGMSRSTVHRILKQREEGPDEGFTYVPESILISESMQIVEKTLDIVGLFFNPPDKILAVSTCENGQSRCSNRTQRLLSLQPLRTEQGTQKYMQNEYGSSLVSLETTGEVMSKRHRKHHRYTELLRFLRLLQRENPKGRVIHLMAEPRSMCRHEKVQSWLSDHPRFSFHFAPNSAAWLDQIQTWFAVLGTVNSHNDASQHAEELAQKVTDFAVGLRQNAGPFIWAKVRNIPNTRSNSETASTQI